MILKYDDFEAENTSRILLYYAFDWDDNILNMPTEIIVITEDGSEIGMSTADFAIYRDKLSKKEIVQYKGENVVGIAQNAFRNFGDSQGNVFLQDLKKSISNRNFGPSWKDFIECLSNGALFAIITARGHESKTMREGVEWIIDNVLTKDEIYKMYNHCLKFSYYLGGDENVNRLPSNKPSQDELIKEYLDHCDFVGVSAPSRGGSPSNPEKAKEDALMSFIDKVDNFINEIKDSTGDDSWVAMIGFSDDDVKNYKHIENLVDNLHNERFYNIGKIVVKGTKDPENIVKKSRTFGVTETSHQTPGLESSVIKFTQFGNMSGHLNPQGPDQRQDDWASQKKRQTEYLAKMSKEVLGKKRKKIKKNPQ